MKSNLKLCLAVVALTGMFTGCTQPLKSTPNAEGITGVFKVATAHETSTVEYIVDPPDELIVKAPNVKEVDGQKQIVRADGKITLNLLGEVKVSGKTPAQIETMLVAIASRYYTNPDIKVEVVANSKFYTIFGRGATTGGKKAYTGNDSLIKALAEAGMNENAWPEQVRLVRPSREGQKPAVVVIDFEHMNQTGDFRQNYVIHEGDMLFLPDSPLASLNATVSKIIGPITGASNVVAGPVRSGSLK